MEDIKYQVGRPSLLDERDENGEFINDKVMFFFQLIASGSTITIASEASGISRRVVTEWETSGKQDLKKGLQTKYSKFFLILKKKQNECKAKLIIEILKNKDWKAKAWYLERMSKEFRIEREEEENKERKVIYNGTMPINQ